MVELEGAIVTIDAMGCQKEIAKTIVAQGAFGDSYGPQMDSSIMSGGKPLHPAIRGVIRGLC
jgi:predicted transposase YbfD/YdcC